MTGISLLDGGLGQEIYKRAPDISHALWSVQVMFDHPEVVVDVHREFIEAGARVICLNTYPATRSRMRHENCLDMFEEAHQTAIRLALQAIDQSGVSGVQLAGCIPPRVGSYIEDVMIDHAATLEDYRAIVEQQADAVDLFLIETMANVTEALAGLDAVQEASKPVCVGLTLADDLSDTLRSGEPLDVALTAILPRKPEAILLNCSVPEAITKAMPKLAGHELPFGGYANGFTSVRDFREEGTVDGFEARSDLCPDTYADFVMKWVDSGATIVGGCCEVGPDHIRRLDERLLAAGHQVGALPFA